MSHQKHIMRHCIENAHLKNCKGLDKLESCFWGSCFALNPAAPKIFGFSDFLAGMALMILAWTTTDVRYRFRVRVAAVPLQRLTFALIGIIGSLTLLTDLWRARGWKVPAAPASIPFSITPEVWQALLGALFFATFLIWAFFAYIKPSIFGRLNAKRYTEAVHHFFLNAPASDQAIIAQELAHSARELVKYATEYNPKQKITEDQHLNSAQLNANTLLSLIGHPSFCRILVTDAPGTAFYFFQAIDSFNKYNLFFFQPFSRNFVNEAIRNKNSFLYHEKNGYASGLMGYDKPFTTLLFSNYKMVEGLDSLLDPEDAWEKGRLDSAQWKAYCNLLITAIEGCIQSKGTEHTPVLYRAIGHVKNALFDIHKIIPDAELKDDTYARLEVVCDFIGQLRGFLAAYNPPSSPLKREDDDSLLSLHDAIAELIEAAIRLAAKVSAPIEQRRRFHSELIWNKLMGYPHNKSSWILNAKVCKLIFSRIRDIRTPASSGCQLLGFCLNVMGLEYQYSGKHYKRDRRLLHRAVLAWTRRNYLNLYYRNPLINDVCLHEGITLDLENYRLAMEFPANTRTSVTRHEYLTLAQSDNQTGEPQ